MLILGGHRQTLHACLELRRHSPMAATTCLYASAVSTAKSAAGAASSSTITAAVKLQAIHFYFTSIVFTIDNNYCL